MSQARRHHVVPRSYLRRFADQNGRLAMLDQANGTWSMPHASDAAVRIGFYTVDIDTGPSDEVERALGQIEGGMMEVLRQLDRELWPPDEAARQAIANFVGLQVVRGVDFRVGDRGSAYPVGSIAVARDRFQTDLEASSR